MRRREQADRKQQILQAAASLFAQEGYKGTSMAAVAEKASVTKALVQYHFATKDQLWRDTVSFIWNQRTEALPHYLDNTVFDQMNQQEQQDIIRILCKQLMKFTLANPNWVKILYQEAAVPGPRLDWLIDTFIRADYENGLALVKLAQSRGLMPQLNPMNLLHIFSGAIIHITNVAPITSRITGIPVTSDAFMDQYVDTLIRLLQPST